MASMAQPGHGGKNKSEGWSLRPCLAEIYWMRTKNTRIVRRLQLGQLPAGVPVDLHAECMLIAAALRCETATPLCGLTLLDFWDEMNKLVAWGIWKFPTQRSTVSQLAATLPAFVRPYLAFLIQYQVFVCIREQRSD